MMRQNPQEERGPQPLNGRGDTNKITKQDCTGCPSNRLRTGEKNNGQTNNDSDSGKRIPDKN